MPAKSRAQFRLMAAAASGATTGAAANISPKVAKEFTSATKNVSKLPEKVEKPTPTKTTKKKITTTNQFQPA